MSEALLDAQSLTFHPASPTCIETCHPLFPWQRIEDHFLLQNPEVKLVTSLTKEEDILHLNWLSCTQPFLYQLQKKIKVKQLPHDKLAFYL